MDEVHSLQIRLHGLPCGYIYRHRDDRTTFEFDPAYLSMPARPVLGQCFEDHLEKRYRGSQALPNWFANLLPEGRLRDRIAQGLAVNRRRAFPLLHELGADLPGAVEALSDTALTPDDAGPEGVSDPDTPLSGDLLKMSLAGVQLKLSMLRQGDRFVLRANGLGGDWIVKFPDPTYPLLPQNEAATMTWAHYAGVHVPEHALVATNALVGLPRDLTLPELLAYRVRRFDRPLPGTRVHMEDLAQVANRPPEKKYSNSAWSYEKLARAVLVLAGPGDLTRFVDQLVFIVGSGNGDAHLKNWTLLYPDRIRPALSPAYDLVSTIQYISNDGLALNLGGSKDFQRVSGETFYRLGHKIGVEPTLIRERALSAAERVRSSLSRATEEQPGPPGYLQRVLAHMDTVPLFRS